MATPAHLNRVWVEIATMGTGTVTCGNAVTAAYCTEVEAGATDAVTYTWMLEEGNDFQIFRGAYTAAGRSVARTTTLLSKIGGSVGAANMDLQGTARLRIVDAKEDAWESSIASQGEAEAGTAADKLVTPQRVKQALDARPASETATGLIEIANNAEARAGTDTTRGLTAAGHKAAHGPAFRATTTGPQTAVTNTWTFSTNLSDSGTDRFDSDNCFASSSFTPNVAGYYLINGQISIPGQGGSRGIAIYKNGSQTEYVKVDAGGGSTTYPMNISGVLFLNGTTDSIQLAALSDWPANGGNINSAQFSGFRLFS